MRFEVLTAVRKQRTLFWYPMFCSSTDICLLKLEDGVSRSFNTLVHNYKNKIVTYQKAVTINRLLSVHGLKSIWCRFLYLMSIILDCAVVNGVLCIVWSPYRLLGL